MASTMGMFVEGLAHKNYISEVLQSIYPDSAPFDTMEEFVDAVYETSLENQLKKEEAMAMGKESIEESAKELGVDPSRVVEAFLVFNLLVEKAILMKHIEIITSRQGE